MEPVSGYFRTGGLYTSDALIINKQTSPSPPHPLPISLKAHECTNTKTYK